MSAHPLQFKVATEEWEFEQVHELNYRTFVEEIPQHQATSTPRLVDKFHAENTYLVCLCGNQVVGMIAARGRRPFSLDQKLPIWIPIFRPDAALVKSACSRWKRNSATARSSAV